MLKKVNKPKSEGFTIIEVMIVLAIAALILLIVFLAIPALQRNSRNTQRRNDVSALAGSLNEFLSNNNGTLPTTAQAAGTGAAVSNARLGFYTTAQVFANNTGTPPTTVSASGGSATVVTTDNVIVWLGYSCNNNTLTAANRNISIEYAVEGNTTPLCVSS